MTDYQSWQLDPLDTWFFREARPFDTLGSPELASQFPPPAATVAGAIKTLLGRQQGIDWHSFKPRASADEPAHPDYAALGRLHLCGPFVSQNGAPLFPAPAFLLHKQDDYQRLRIGQPVETDLGIVCLPELPEECRNQGGYKPLERTWLSRSGLERVLEGYVPDPNQVITADELYSPEPRLGIGRNNQTGCVDAEAGLLYQTCHVRPHDQTGLLVGVKGMADAVQPEPVRLGGEGRLTLMHANRQPLPLPQAPGVTGQPRGLILLLLTAADLDNCWRLPGCDHPECPERDSGEAQIWPCEVNGVRLHIQAAILGKPQREGGWHLAERKPRRVESLVPAGSAWFCTVPNGNLQAAIERLHLSQIGDGQTLGRGLLAVGVWE